ncbi:MAG: DNA-3-methyladenine glycosylase I [Candidatus Marsarchaeota archaeon]|nr:DNA-3-methyladenine glycosylase I [Candidatus Marsarchaeota archaeon]
MEAERRCNWPSLEGNALYLNYHDSEWGVPVHDDRKLFEFIILEGAQAGLSWLTILKRRANYRKAFDNFDPRRVARYDERKIRDLLNDSGIIRNRLKVASAIRNAQSFISIQEEFGSFDEYIWQFVPGSKPIKNRWKNFSQVPPRTSASDAMSRDLIKRGFSFAGSTICYAHMQATGMVNDHITDCFRYNEV